MRRFLIPTVAISLLLIIGATVQAISLTAYEARYISLPSNGKLAELERRMTHTEYRGSLPTKSKGGFKLLAALLPSYLHVTFQRESDFMPQERQKVIHPFGSAGQVKLVIDQQHGQTGLLKTGGDAIARFSTATMGLPFSGAMALKFPIDGQPSVNFITMKALDGQGSDTNMFRHPFTNIIPAPTSRVLKIGARIFQLAVDTMPNGPDSALALPLHEAVSVHQDGRRSPSPALVDQIIFEPTSEVTQYVDRVKVGTSDFREVLRTIPVGSTLYNVFIKEHVVAPATRKLYIGRLILTSPLRASSFSDHRLFFQHPRPVYR